MLSHKVLTRQDIGSAVRYYEDGADDYYAKDGDASAWQGKGAEILGLSGTVESGRLRELLAGRVAPGEGLIRSATRDDSKDRIGIDFTFSAPKSVSLQALVSGDSRIIAAHDKAVARTLELAESLAQARQKVNGKSRVEDTGNLTIAKFRHETSREQEPQLHTHAVIINLTQRADGKWRALRNDKLVKSTRYLGSVYNAELAEELQKIGYDLRFERDGNFELAHIDREQIAAFSSRAAQVEEKLAEKGLDRTTATAQEKQQAALQSRAKKEKVVDREALHAKWQSKAAELGINFDGHRTSSGGKGKVEKSAASMAKQFLPADEAARRAVRYAINHLTERQSVMSGRQLRNVALNHAVGAAKHADIEKEITKQIVTGYLIKEDTRYKPAEGGDALTRREWIEHLQEKGLNKSGARTYVDTAVEKGGLVAEEARYTTQTALEREKRILQIERDGRGAVEPIMQAEVVTERLQPSSLNDGQRKAAELILTTDDRVIGVQGFAGVGKSHMLDTAKQAIEAEGYTVRALAPYASQVRALRELGVQSNTLASFLKAKEKDIDARTVLVIDEAGVVPTRQMEQVLKLAERAGSRVVLLGDTAQTKAIEAGRPFHQLQAAGMKTAQMTEILRQQDKTLKHAVELAAKGESKESLANIEVTEIKEHSARREEVARVYVELSPAERDKTIIVSGTNEARREINRYVREKIQLAGAGKELDTLVRRDTTQAERRFSKNYRVGDVIQPEKDYKSGLKRGELYTIEDTGPGNRLTVRSQSDEDFTVTFNPLTHSKLSVYEPERAEFSPGDLVRITRNDAALDLANGDRFKVEKLDKDKIVLANENRRVELSTEKPLHACHAYATTVHSSQGLTANRVIVDMEAESKTTAKDVYYVAISRARHSAKIFTNDKSKLPAAIARENVKYAALDLVRGGAPQHKITDHQKSHQNERENQQKAKEFEK